MNFRTLSKKIKIIYLSNFWNFFEKISKKMLKNKERFFRFINRKFWSKLKTVKFTHKMKIKEFSSDNTRRLLSQFWKILTFL